MTRILIWILFPIIAKPALCELKPIVPGRVRVGGEIGDRIDRTIDNNFMVLDLENDFLKPFREKNANGGFVGLGMLIDSAVKLAAYSRDEKVIERKDLLIDEALKNQEAEGYLGMMKPESRLWSLWDIHEMSYLITGLIADHRLFDSTRSLEAAKRIADYIIEGWSAHPDREPGNGDITVYMAVTGSESAMLDLYEITGEKRYLDYCTELRNLDEWNGPIVLGRWGPIQGHAYAYMSRCLAQIQLNKIQPNPELLKPTQKALRFLIEDEGLVISGTCGDHECWHNTQDGTTNLGETCATAYLLRFLDRLYRDNSSPVFGDIMDRAIYNSLFGAQSPDGREIRYYTPYEVAREYFEKDTYCCPCNYRRILGDLPYMIYYQTDNGLLVNLYTTSKATIDLPNEQSLTITQITDYPSSGTVDFKIGLDRPATFEISMRTPRWCSERTLSINDEGWVADPIKGGGIHTIKREWKDGDSMRLELPMPPRWVKGRVNQAGRVALMSGPRVFGVNREVNDLDNEVDLRLVTLAPETLEGPFPDDTYREGGVAYTVEGWKPGEWYPLEPKSLTLRLTEFPDPGIEAVYFKVPNPNEEGFVEDELALRDSASD